MDERREMFRTPALPRHLAALRQNVHTPGSHEGGVEAVVTEEETLNSSAVRGNAAMGLLGLRQER